MRRFTSLSLTLLLLHLSMTRADLTCVRHGFDDSDLVSHSEHSAHLGHDARAVTEEQTEHPSSDAPTLPACCQALVSCGVSIAGNLATTTTTLSKPSARILTAAAATPRSWESALDPPPPRA